ncbi:hypothetical protein MW887_011512 [Aspergillus wentii]|nr:hypothetical protein MW887_011512 [Aspergillus wentii]
MKFWLALLALELGTSSAWILRDVTHYNVWQGTGALSCKPLYIPQGSKIEWTGSNGAQTVQLFDTQRRCSSASRTISGTGTINASKNYYGLAVKIRE